MLRNFALSRADKDQKISGFQLPLAGADFFVFLGRLARAAQNAQDFLFTQDQQLFAFNLDFRAGILAKEDAIAVLDRQGNGLAFFVFSSTNCNDDALLGLFFCSVRDDDAAANRLRLFNATKKNAIMQGSELLCHVLLLSECSFMRVLRLLCFFWGMKVSC